jgi:hypothetical protein
MGQSYRIRTELGVNKSINVELEQQFEFLEILSLTLQQEDIYTKSCSQYGVVVGRVTANNGFGIPNARVSIFIPIDSVDESNPIISSIYPYKSPSDKNEDGYRYNLLPYEKSYSVHAATGTLPSRLDVLTGDTAVQIYDKYYKYTVKTNESGDYMIMGVPQGNHTLVMDVDLSDIGEFSLSPQDLIRMGLASETQVAGNRFRSSNDLNSLPQIINIVKNVEVSPLWGDPELCDIAINRVDFDLRDDANVDIQPTATFMGSIYSSNDDMRVRQGQSINDDLGNLCGLIAGPGRILAIRQTVYQDEDGNPVLEQYQLEQSGNIIDENGAWLTELPMNLDYFITNEFGEKVLSNDPTIGIPTKGKYRLKIKWEQSTGLSEQVKRPHFLVPNVREYGWSSNNPDLDPLYSPNPDARKKLASSYYFGLSWSGYTDGFTGPNEKFDRIQDIIDCEDTFYQFGYNKVYTVSGLIDQYKNGGRGNFIGIKEIDSNDCSATINKFPVNEGFRNFDFLFFLFSFILQIIQMIMVPIIVVIRIVLFLYYFITQIFCRIAGICIPLGFTRLCPFGWLRSIFGCNGLNTDLKLGMLTYPECESCNCESQVNSNIPVDSNNPDVTTSSGDLTPLSFPSNVFETWSTFISENNPDYDSDSINNYASILSQATTGYELKRNDNTKYKLPISFTQTSVDGKQLAAYSPDLPLGERVNIFNQRQSFFKNINKIKVTFAKDINIGKSHDDNTITVLANTNNTYSAGDLLTFVNFNESKDKNYLYAATTQNGKQIYGIDGFSAYPQNGVTVTFATGQYSDSTVNYSLPPISTLTNYSGITRNIYPADIEYYQVLTAITISQAKTIWNTGTVQSFPNILNSPSTIEILEGQKFAIIGTVWNPYSAITISNPIEYYENYEDQVILILQRGVDPYSPKFNNEYDVSLIFGQPTNTPGFVFTASTRINIPIQKIPFNGTSVQGYTLQTDIFYPSQFFTPGIPSATKPGLQFSAYTTSATTYYGLQDANNRDAATDISSLFPPFRVVTRTDNLFYNANLSSSKYDLSEDVSGMGYMWLKNNGSRPFFNNDRRYYTKSIPVTSANSPNMSDRLKNVLRTDRLPTSDKLDGFTWDYNPSILQQNINFGIYSVPGEGFSQDGDRFTGGASISTPSLSGLPSNDAMQSFSCPNLVPLDCYTNFGTNFEVKVPCNDPQGVGFNYVENGCYILLRGPEKLFGFVDDWKIWAEWSARYRFIFALCRGVLSQSFTNNWINGSLYMFPIQNNTKFNNQNIPTPPVIPYDLVYYDDKTFNFYYRCSPYTGTRFIGRPPGPIGSPNPVNARNLMFPTTIINLGYKDSFYSEVTFEPETNAYIIPSLNPTSYGDTSDLVNLFVVSRLVDSEFLSQVLGFLNDSISLLFQRYKTSFPANLFQLRRARVDADFVQLCSINSEIGNVNFSPQFYSTTDDSATILGQEGNPVMAVMFSSTTNDLQVKDYLTPGRINFRSTDNQQNFPYPYGIKSQIVPNYRWGLNSGQKYIFGNRENNWATSTIDIDSATKRYQSLDRLSPNTYFIGNNISVNDTYARGYIYAANNDGSYNFNITGAKYSKFIVGAPFHFYFGTIKGATALELFKRKYSVSE